MNRRTSKRRGVTKRPPHSGLLALHQVTPTGLTLTAFLATNLQHFKRDWTQNSMRIQQNSFYSIWFVGLNSVSLCWKEILEESRWAFQETYRSKLGLSFWLVPTLLEREIILMHLYRLTLWEFSFQLKIFHNPSQKGYCRFLFGKYQSSRVELAKQETLVLLSSHYEFLCSQSFRNGRSLWLNFKKMGICSFKNVRILCKGLNIALELLIRYSYRHEITNTGR